MMDRLALQVYNQLRHDIVTGVLRPNQSITEADIAERLKVSRTPVRESLQRLANDGMVVSQRRRWIVYEFTADEVREIYEVRAALESAAAALACRRMTDHMMVEIEALEPAATRFHTVARDERVEINNRFHGLIVHAAGNSRLERQVEQNQLYYFNRRVAALYSQEELAESSRQHGELVQALRDRDAERAKDVVQRHVDHALNLIITKLF